MRIKKVIIAAFILLVIMTACSSSSKNSSTAQSAPQLASGREYGEAYNNATPAYETESYAMDEMSVDSQISGTRTVNQDKIIKTADITAETANFQEMMDNLRSMAEANGGFTASSSLYTINTSNQRSYYITMKIPSENYTYVKESIESMAKKLGRLVSASEAMENVTAEYYDMESRLKTKETEEQRVLEMINKAAKVEDLLALEERLGAIRTDIELHRSRLTNIDRLVAYSTINTRITETLPDNILLSNSDDLLSRIKSSFIKSINATKRALEAIAIFMAGAVPPLVILAVLALVAYMIYRMIAKKSKNVEL